VPTPTARPRENAFSLNHPCLLRHFPPLPLRHPSRLSLTRWPSPPQASPPEIPQRNSFAGFSRSPPSSPPSRYRIPQSNRNSPAPPTNLRIRRRIQKNLSHTALHPPPQNSTVFKSYPNTRHKVSASFSILTLKASDDGGGFPFTYRS